MVLVGRSFLSALLPCSEEALGAGLPHKQTNRRARFILFYCCRSAKEREEERKHDEVSLLPLIKECRFPFKQPANSAWNSLGLERLQHGGFSLA